jgi:hypothetical protein
MKTAFLLPLLLCLPSCSAIMDWREVSTAPMTYGECYDGLAYIANRDGFTADLLVSDRGLGYWQSRWRERQLGLGRPGRYRLCAEILIDEGSSTSGWTIRYAIEQQKVKDLRKSLEPTEDDWSSDGQDRERETIFGEKLVRKLCNKTQ